MFYFFRRGEQFVRCELQTSDDDYKIVIVREDGTESVENFENDQQLTERWSALQQQFLRDGWWGPHGRD
jgi:hypothetical protein